MMELLKIHAQAKSPKLLTAQKLKCKGGERLQKEKKQMGRPPKPASRKQRAKARRLKMGLRLIDVADFLGISFQSLTSKETGEQPWKWAEIKKLIELYHIETIEELLKLF